MIGSGMVDTGRISEMTGTALAVCALSDVLPPYFEGIKVSAYYMRKGRFCLLMWAPTAGMALEWFKKNFCADIDYKTLDAAAEKVPFGSEGLLVSPNMCGSVMPEKDEALKGGVYGVDLKQTRAHFARAIMESVACLIKNYADYLNPSAKEIVSIGGGAKSRTWLKIKADVAQKTFVTLKTKETGCLGSATGLSSLSNRRRERRCRLKTRFFPRLTKPIVASALCDRHRNKFGVCMIFASGGFAGLILMCFLYGAGIAVALVVSVCILFCIRGVTQTVCGYFPLIMKDRINSGVSSLMMNASACVGAALMPLLTGLIMDKAGWEWYYISVTAFAVILVFLILFGAVHDRKKRNAFF